MRSVAAGDLWGRGYLARQYEVEARVADEALLRNRLRKLGVRRPIVVHENRTVMVSLGRSGKLRIHRGYAYSADRTLRAIIDFVNAGNRSTRAVAEREILAFPIESYLPRKQRRRKRRVSARDGAIVAALEAMHADLNTRFFHGGLAAVPFRISDRMRTRLGEVTVDPRSPRLLEITLSRSHWERDGEEEVAKTLLHEMIHQWQAESGLTVDHGVMFRRKAREIGVPPVARRMIERLETAGRKREFEG